MTMREEAAAKEAAYLNDLAQARRAAQIELERVREQSETEAADLRATISRLEAQLATVRFSRACRGKLAYFLTMPGLVGKQGQGWRNQDAPG